MTAALLDTHAWFWLFTGEKRLPDAAVKAVEEAETAFVCSISVYEIARKAQLGTWPEMDCDALDRLARASVKAGIEILPASPEAMIVAGFLDWRHRDPWNRLIAGMALERAAMLISADAAFDAAPGLKRVWL